VISHFWVLGSLMHRALPLPGQNVSGIVLSGERGFSCALVLLSLNSMQVVSLLFLFLNGL
jgi:hypothetical protein